MFGQLVLQCRQKPDSIFHKQGVYGFYIENANNRPSKEPRVCTEVASEEERDIRNEGM
jgi:hypothetical protein